MCSQRFFSVFLFWSKIPKLSTCLVQMRKEILGFSPSFLYQMQQLYISPYHYGTKSLGLHRISSSDAKCPSLSSMFGPFAQAWLWGATRRTNPRWLWPNNFGEASTHAHTNMHAPHSASRVCKNCRNCDLKLLSVKVFLKNSKRSAGIDLV